MIFMGNTQVPDQFSSCIPYHTTKSFLSLGMFLWWECSMVKKSYLALWYCIAMFYFYFILMGLIWYGGNYWIMFRSWSFPIQEHFIMEVKACKYISGYVHSWTIWLLDWFIVFVILLILSCIHGINRWIIIHLLYCSQFLLVEVIKSKENVS